MNRKLLIHLKIFVTYNPELLVNLETRTSNKEKDEEEILKDELEFYKSLLSQEREWKIVKVTKVLSIILILHRSQNFKTTITVETKISN